MPKPMGGLVPASVSCMWEPRPRAAGGWAAGPRSASALVLPQALASSGGALVLVLAGWAVGALPFRPWPWVGLLVGSGLSQSVSAVTRGRGDLVTLPPRSHVRGPAAPGLQ